MFISVDEQLMELHDVPCTMDVYKYFSVYHTDQSCNGKKLISLTTENILPPNITDSEIFLAASSKGFWDVTDGPLSEVAHLEASADPVSYPMFHINSCVTCGPVC